MSENTMNKAGNEGGSVTVGLPEGVTYFIRVDDAIKIGSATHFKRRLHALQTAHEKPIEVLAVIPMALADEFKTHQQFAHLRIRGEWFRSEPELLNFIEEMKGTASRAEPAPGNELSEIAKHLARRRPSLLPDAQPIASNLIEQIKNYNSGTGNRPVLAGFIQQSMERLSALSAFQ